MTSIKTFKLFGSITFFALYIKSILTTFEANFIFWVSLGSSKNNWLKLKVKPPFANLAWLNKWNTLYVIWMICIRNVCPFATLTSLIQTKSLPTFCTTQNARITTAAAKTSSFFLRNNFLGKKIVKKSQPQIFDVPAPMFDARFLCCPCKQVGQNRWVGNDLIWSNYKCKYSTPICQFQHKNLMKQSCIPFQPFAYVF